MVNTMKEEFKEQLRLCKLYKKESEELKKTICIKNINPKTTMVIYFGSLQMNYFISEFLKLRKRFKDLNVFEDAFDSYDFLPVNKLWLFCNNIDNNKDTVQQLIDINFMNSKSRTLKLFDMKPEAYEETLNLWNTYLDLLILRLENIEDTWYKNNVHLELQNYYINKEEMAIYKLISIPFDEERNFILRKCTQNDKGQDMISEVRINPDFIRESIEEEVFLEHRLSEKYPEYFL